MTWQNLFTRAVERFNDLRENIEKTLGCMEILLLSAPPDELDAYGKPQYNVGLYDPIPEKWYEPPPAAELLLETKTSKSRGSAGKPTLPRAMTWRTWRVLHEIQNSPQLFSDLFSYVENGPQLTLMVDLLNTCVPVEGSVHHVTSPYLQTMLSDPDRAYYDLPNFCVFIMTRSRVAANLHSTRH